MLLELARKLIGDAKKRSIAVGLLILKLGKTRPSVDVQDNDKAVAYLNWLIVEQDKKIYELEQDHKAARLAEDEDSCDLIEIKIATETAVKKELVACLNAKITVYKSALPENLKVKLTELHAEATGMVFNPGGDDKLTIE
jgi:hypothetical protein